MAQALGELATRHHHVHCAQCSRTSNSPVARGKPGARMHDSHRILMALLRTLVPGSVEAWGGIG